MIMLEFYNKIIIISKKNGCEKLALHKGSPAHADIKQEGRFLFK